jgi:Plasmid replication region DNA-binding N-term
MARALVTQAMINEAAEALLAEGAEVTVINLRSRVGGGSFTTISNYLQVWRGQRVSAMAAVPATPVDIEAEGRDFIQKIWALASRQAQSAAQSVKDGADADVAALRAELAAATAEIARLEQGESQQSITIEQLEEALQAANILAAENGVEARRAAALDQALIVSSAELKAALQAVTDKAVEVGRLTGEVETLRRQSQEWMTAIQSKTP